MLDLAISEALATRNTIRICSSFETDTSALETSCLRRFQHYLPRGSDWRCLDPAWFSSDMPNTLSIATVSPHCSYAHIIWSNQLAFSTVISGVDGCIWHRADIGVSKVTFRRRGAGLGWVIGAFLDDDLLGAVRLK